MERISERDALIERITFLEAQQTEDLAGLKDQLQLSYDSLRPLNFIKSTIHEITSSADIKSDLIQGAINLTTNLIGKNIIGGIAETPIKKLMKGIFRFIVKKINPRK